MKTEKILASAGVVLIIWLAFQIVLGAEIVGVSESRLEQDAREEQHIESSWEAVQDIKEGICAMLFFDEDREEHTYSIYLTREGLSYGYFFRQGGQMPYLTEGVRGVVFEDKGIVLMSLNRDKVSKITLNNQSAEKIIQVDPAQPFVVVLPLDCGEITLYDAQDNIVTLYDTYTGA